MQAMLRVLACLWLCLMAAAPAHAGETRVAVAANFAAPAQALVAAFGRRTGHQAVLVLGATGALATQIAHGAPFDLLLAADAERPAQLAAAGLAVPNSRFTYAIGQLVLYSTDPHLVDPAGRVLAGRGFTRLAIADPAAAPYGAAAVATLQRLGLWAAVQPRLVTGSSIGQAFQFVQTGAAELGFVAAGQLVGVTGGSRWSVPARLHPPIVQQAVLLRAGAANPAAQAFLRFLHQPAAAAVIRRYGYAVPVR